MENVVGLRKTGGGVHERRPLAVVVGNGEEDECWGLNPSSDESSSSTFRIDSLETFVFLPHVDDTQRGDKKAEDDSHESVNRGEYIVENYIRKVGDRSNTEHLGVVIVRNIQSIDETGGRWVAEVGLDSKIGRVEIATATELVLYELFSAFRNLAIDLVEIGPFSKSEEPNESSDNNNANRVDEEKVVEDDKTNSNMVALNDSSDRKYECYGQCDSQYHSRCQVCISDDHVHQDVGLPPNNRKGNRNCTTPQECDVQNRPNGHQCSRNHICAVYS